MVPLLFLEKGGVLGLSKESQFPLAPEGGSVGSYGPVSSIHRLLGQGQGVQCEPLVQPKHSLIGMFSSTQTGGNSTGPQDGDGWLSWQWGFRDGPRPEYGEFGGLMVPTPQYLSTDPQVLIRVFSMRFFSP